MLYRQCPYCGANLDPEEVCECRQEAEEQQRVTEREAKIEALRQSLQEHKTRQEKDRERTQRLEILRAQLKNNDGKSA